MVNTTHKNFLITKHWTCEAAVLPWATWVYVKPFYCIICSVTLWDKCVRWFTLAMYSLTVLEKPGLSSSAYTFKQNTFNTWNILLCNHVHMENEKSAKGEEPENAKLSSFIFSQSIVLRTKCVLRWIPCSRCLLWFQTQTFAACHQVSLSLSEISVSLYCHAINKGRNTIKILKQFILLIFKSFLICAVAHTKNAN